MKILTVNNLSKVYGKKIIFNALNDINFSIEDGEFVGIMGPSGSGSCPSTIEILCCIHAGTEVAGVLAFTS